MTGTVNVTGIILLFLGGFLLLRGLPGVLEVLRARSWRKVPGTILGSGVAGYQTSPGGGHGRAPMQHAVFAYSYEYGGHIYSGHRAAFGTPLGFGMGLGAIASQHAARYTPGQQVDVWVDPANPANSVLRRSASSSLLFAVIGAVVLIAAVASFVS